MPRPCSICVHPDRNEIERVLLELDPSSQVLRPVTERWADISKQALARHRDQGHIVKAVVKAQGIKEALHGDTILDRLKELSETMQGVIQEAKQTGGSAMNPLAHLDVITKAVARLEKHLEFEAKLLGELRENSVNITVNQGADMAMLARLIDAGLCSGCRLKIVDMERAVTGEWKAE